LENKISYWHIVLFAVAFPFDRFYSELILISFAIHTLIQLRKETLYQLPYKQILLLASVFLLTIFCISYSPNKMQAFDDTGRQLAILLFPVLFAFDNLNQNKYRHQILYLISLVCVYVVIYLYTDAIRTILFYHLPFTSLLTATFLNHHFSQPIGIHATYLSMYVAIAFVFFLQQLLIEKKKLKKIGYTATSLLLLCGIIQLSSRAVFISLLLIVNIVLPFVGLKKETRFKYILTSFLVSATLVIFLSNNHTFKERYFTDTQSELTFNSIKGYDAEPRIERWKVAVSIIKNSPVVGHGSGTEISLLKEEYFLRKMYVSFLNELNTHNQYLSLLIKTGIAGLSLFLFTLFAGFKKAIHQKDSIFLSFLIIVSTVSFSENILDTNKGIFYYSFFFSFFFLTKKQAVTQQKKTTTTKINSNPF
jgi:O-antigen ligase